MRDYNAILELAKEKAQSEAQEKGLSRDCAEWFIRGYIEGFMLGYAEGCVNMHFVGCLRGSRPEKCPDARLVTGSRDATQMARSSPHSDSTILHAFR